MKLFKVLGIKSAFYYMDISAEDSEQAYDIALERNQDDWTLIEAEDVLIEIVEVEEVDE